MVGEGSVVDLINFNFRSVFRHLFKINFLSGLVVLTLGIIHLVRTQKFSKN